MEPQARAATADDDAAWRARLGGGADEALGGVLAADLAAPGPDSAAWCAGDAYGRVARNARPGTWLVAVLGGDAPTRAALLRAAARHVSTVGGGTVTWWAPDATALDDEAAKRAGFTFARAQHQLRVALPLAETPRWPRGTTVRAFADDDVDAWLAVNNAAFADHPEQGGWTRETFAARRRESWFDPDLFVLAMDTDGMAGFDWLKVHDDTDPRLGEIYAIAVAPGRQGRGLGRALALEGLSRVAARGLMTGMLYVAADNEPALALYRSLGFTTHTTDHAYELQVTP